MKPDLHQGSHCCPVKTVVSPTDQSQNETFAFVGEVPWSEAGKENCSSNCSYVKMTDLKMTIVDLMNITDKDKGETTNAPTSIEESEEYKAMLSMMLGKENMMNMMMMKNLIGEEKMTKMKMKINRLQRYCFKPTEENMQSKCVAPNVNLNFMENPEEYIDNEDEVSDVGINKNTIVVCSYGGAAKEYESLITSYEKIGCCYYSQPVYRMIDGEMLFYYDSEHWVVGTNPQNAGPSLQDLHWGATCPFEGYYRSDGGWKEDRSLWPYFRKTDCAYDNEACCRADLHCQWCDDGHCAQRFDC